MNLHISLDYGIRNQGRFTSFAILDGEGKSAAVLNMDGGSVTRCAAVPGIDQAAFITAAREWLSSNPIPAVSF